MQKDFESYKKTKLSLAIYFSVLVSSIKSLSIMAQSSQKAVVIQISGQLYLKTYGSKVFLDANFPDASK